MSIKLKLLFQRLLVVTNASPIETNEVFLYELCRYPPAIFESPSMLRKADRPKIVDSIVNHVMLTDPECMCYKEWHRSIHPW